MWVEAAHNITAVKLVETRDKVGEIRGGWPRYIRCDNGPEFISQALKTWAEEKGIEIRFTQPRKPTQNEIIERLNRTVRKECLNLNWFYSLDEVNDLLGQWYKTYILKVNWFAKINPINILIFNALELCKFLNSGNSGITLTDPTQA